jgi:hypothetical protein
MAQPAKSMICTKGPVFLHLYLSSEALIENNALQAERSSSKALFQQRRIQYSVRVETNKGVA